MNSIYNAVLEDDHLQLDLGDEYKQLWDYDIIMRTNDARTEYTGFDVFDFKNQNHIIFIPFKKEGETA